MNICYYNSQIKEELDGAKAYIEKAISYKKSHPEWAKLFVDMSSAELSHAKNLLTIFEDDYKKTTEEMDKVDPIYPQVKEELTNMYTECVTKVRVMHDIYASK